MSGVAPMRRDDSIRRRSRSESSGSISSETERPVSPQLCSRVIDCLSKTASSIFSCCNGSDSEYTQVHQGNGSELDSHNYGTFETQDDMSIIDTQLSEIDKGLGVKENAEAVSNLCKDKPLGYSETLLFYAMKKNILFKEIAIGYTKELSQTGPIEVGFDRSVRFPESPDMILVTHNHPNDGLPLSEPDLRNAVRLGLTEVRAVANNNGIFSIRFNDMHSPQYTNLKSGLRRVDMGKLDAIRNSEKLYNISSSKDVDLVDMLNKFVINEVGESSFNTSPKDIKNLKKSSFLKNLLGCINYSNAMGASFSFSPIKNSTTTLLDTIQKELKSPSQTAGSTTHSIDLGES